MNGKYSNDNFQVLADCNDGDIGKCNCCHEYNFSYKSILLTFTEDQLVVFLIG
jgi:hypothetical protein